MAYKYYNQNDYPEIPYGDGSIETSGCGLCSCCMVVENMTGHAFTPAEAARLAYECGACDETGTEISILAPAVCKRFGLTYELTCDSAADRMFRFIRMGRDVEKIGAPKQPKLKPWLTLLIDSWKK